MLKLLKNWLPKPKCKNDSEKKYAYVELSARNFAKFYQKLIFQNIISGKIAIFELIFCQNFWYQKIVRHFKTQRKDRDKKWACFFVCKINFLSRYRICNILYISWQNFGSYVKNGIFNGVLTFQVTWLVMKFYLVTERWSISAVWGAHLLRFF